MGNDIAQWRQEIGLHYYRNRGVNLRLTFRTTLFNVTFLKQSMTSFMLFTMHVLCNILYYVRTLNLAVFISVYTLASGMSLIQTNVPTFFHDNYCIASSQLSLYIISLRFLLLLSGDIECNPGPLSPECLTVFHLNIRSIRNKMNYIRDTFSECTHSILCFTETHLSHDIGNDLLQIEGFDTMFRKDKNAHSGGFIVYTSSLLSPQRILDLELLLPESVWVKIKDHSQTFLICTVYRQPSSTMDFWNKLNICIEKAIEISPHIILVGDINEDQLNPSNHKLKDIMTLNNLRNIIKDPTRVTSNSSTLIDITVLSSSVHCFDAGIFETDRTISDHYGTYVHIKTDFMLEEPYKRRIWEYKKANFTLLNELIESTDWSFIEHGTVDTATKKNV